MNSEKKMQSLVHKMCTVFAEMSKGVLYYNFQTSPFGGNFQYENGMYWTFKIWWITMILRALDKPAWFFISIELFGFLPQPQLNHNSTQQKLGLTLHHPQPAQKTQRQCYLSCSWPDFNQNLSEGFKDEEI